MKRKLFIEFKTVLRFIFVWCCYSTTVHMQVSVGYTGLNMSRHETHYAAPPSCPHHINTHPIGWAFLQDIHEDGLQKTTNSSPCLIDCSSVYLMLGVTLLHVMCITGWFLDIRISKEVCMNLYPALLNLLLYT